MMIDETQRFLHLIDELRNSNLLITDGFGALQEIDTGNDFYHLPHQLIASGLERLMKCYVAVVHHGRTSTFPDMAFMKDLGHNLDDLVSEIRQNYYGGRNRPFVDAEFDFISNDHFLNDAIGILSLFGRLGRYYNLDVVAGSPHNPRDPKSEWKTLEAKIESPTPFLSDFETLHREYYPRVNAQVVGRLERFVRSIALQFTIGDHTDPNKYISQASVTFSNFRNIRDEALGQNDYRRSVKILNQQKENWVKRSESEILGSDSLSKIVRREDFDGDWPFRAGRVILECIDSTFLVANIEGYAYSLNGAASSRFNIPSSHDAGVAILGKSIGPFAEIARKLKPT